MGNEQSVETPRTRKPPNRLSKPRTNTSTATSNLLSISSPNLSQRSSVADLVMARKDKRLSSMVAVNEGGGENVQPALAEKMKRRLSLFRSKSSSEKAPPPPLEAYDPHSFVDVVMANPLDRYSQIGQPTYELAGDSHYPVHDTRSTLRPQRSSTYQPYCKQPSRLSLVVEVKTPEASPPTESKQLGHLAEPSGIDRRHSMISAPLSGRINSDESNTYPIRRRSMLTPGIATRVDAEGDNFRTKHPLTRSITSTQPFRTPPPQPSRIYHQPKRSNTMPSEDEIRQYYYDQSKPTSSPLGQLASMEIHPRTETPCDQGYGHIGALKLGSLWITNGTASPGPSVVELEAASLRRGLITNHDEDFITESESRGVSEDHNSTRLYERKSEPAGEEESKSYFVPGHATGASLGSFDFEESDGTLLQSPFAELYGDEPKIPAPAADQPGNSVDESNPRPYPSLLIPLQINPNSPTRALDMARAYMSDIASSPFSFDDSRPASPELQTTSKHTAAEDDLFDEARGSMISVPELIIPPLRNPNRNQDTGSSVKELDVQSPTTKSHHQVFANNVQNSRNQPTPLTKADSGYSSNASLRSLRTHKDLHQIRATAPSPPGPTVPDKNPPPTPPKTLYSRNSYGMSLTPSVDRNPGPPANTAPTPTTPTRHPRTRHSYTVTTTTTFVSTQRSVTVVPNVSSNSGLSTAPVRRAPPIPLPIQSTPQVLITESQNIPRTRHSMPLLTREAHSPEPSPTASETSISSISRKLRKQRRASQQLTPQPPPTVQSYYEIAPGSVPSVPAHVSAALAERLKKFPTLTHTYRSLHHTNSKETLATILSLDQQEEVSPLSGYETSGCQPPFSNEIERFSSRDSAPTSAVSAPELSRKSQESRRSQGRRHSVESDGDDDDGISAEESQYQDAFVQHITSFDAVSYSLGASPYDVAMNSLSNNRRQSWSQSSPAGHNGRATGMDSEAASQFARDRSKARETERRRSLTSRRSYDGKAGFDDRGGIPGKLFKPQSLIADAPPIPMLPSEEMMNQNFPKKTKSPPPVSMVTRGKVQHLSLPPPSRKPPSPPTVEEPCNIVPVLPSLVSSNPTRDEQTERRSSAQEDPWEVQRQLWRERRQTATESMQQDQVKSTPPAVETAQPAIANPEGTHYERSPRFSARASFLAQYEKQYPPQVSRPPDSYFSKPATEYTKASPPHLSSNPSWDSLSYQPHQYQQGSASTPATPARSPPPLNNHHPLRSHPSMNRKYTQSQANLRSKPLILDRYSGGMGYSFEQENSMWGMDFSDVPVLPRCRDEVEV